MARFDIKLDVASISGLSDRLSRLTPEALGAATVQAINDTTDSVYQLARAQMTATLNLTDDYIRRKMEVTRATTQTPESVISAVGSRSNMTSLSHYGAMQERKAANNPARAKGDEKRGIPKGQKAAGLSVEVTRGSRKLLAHGFTMPNKRDNSGNLLVFTRDRAGKVRSRTGPSVYQLFRSAAQAVGPDAEKQLRDSLIEQADQAIARALT